MAPASQCLLDWIQNLLNRQQWVPLLVGRVLYKKVLAARLEDALDLGHRLRHVLNGAKNLQLKLSKSLGSLL